MYKPRQSCVEIPGFSCHVSHWATTGFLLHACLTIMHLLSLPKLNNKAAPNLQNPDKPTTDHYWKSVPRVEAMAPCFHTLILLFLTIKSQLGCWLPPLKLQFNLSATWTLVAAARGLACAACTGYSVWPLSVLMQTVVFSVYRKVSNNS